MGFIAEGEILTHITEMQIFGHTICQQLWWYQDAQEVQYEQVCKLRIALSMLKGI